MRVLAIPQAGMGAWAFQGWSLPETVELLPVELPGRNSRMLEPKGQSMRQLVSALVDALSHTLDEKPFVVFGHSLGAWMAYEVCVELAQRLGEGVDEGRDELAHRLALRFEHTRVPAGQLDGEQFHRLR